VNGPTRDTPTTRRPHAARPLLAQRLLALFGAGVLVFNFPLLKLWLTEATVFGLPLLPVALFGAWALLIGLLAWWMEAGASARAEDAQDRRHEA
jgi:hypothetical protein